MLNHPLLDQLDSSIGDLAPGESVEFGGEWTTSSRQAYKSEAQIGTGSGPFVEVVDFRWRGVLTSASPFSGIAFLLTADNLYWAKAPEVSLTLPVDMSLHAYAGYTAVGATFTASLAGAVLPGAPVAASADLAGAFALGPNVLITGRVECLARTSSAAFFVLLIPRGLLKMGRKRLWRLRDDVASSLPRCRRIYASCSSIAAQVPFGLSHVEELSASSQCRRAPPNTGLPPTAAGAIMNRRG